MKIAHLVRQFHPAIGGLEEFVMNLASAQRKQALSVEVVTLNRNFQTNDVLPPSDRINDISVRRVPYLGSRRYPIAPGVVKHLAGCDLIHIHAIDFFCDYIALLKKLKIIEVPVVVSTHGGIFHTNNNLGLKKLFFRHVSRHTLNVLDEVACCSISDLTTFEAIRADLHLIENGVRMHKFGDGRAGGGNAMIYLGRLSQNKNLGQLMQWVSALHGTGFAIDLHIVGQSHTGDTVALRNLHTLLPGRDRIHLDLDLDNAAICNVIERCRYVVSASAHEGFGMAIPELMSYGLVPILSDIPPFRHFIGESGCGALFENNKDSFIQAVKSLELSADRQSPVERAARFAHRYHWPLVEQKFRALYNALLR
jgi:alpha-1,3-mannosyltransferase